MHRVNLFDDSHDFGLDAQEAEALESMDTIAELTELIGLSDYCLLVLRLSDPEEDFPEC